MTHKFYREYRPGGSKHKDSLVIRLANGRDAWLIEGLIRDLDISFEKAAESFREITREEALTEFPGLQLFLSKAETHRGAFFHSLTKE